VPFQVYIFEYFDRRARRGHAYYFLNLTEEQLRDRIVAAWDRGDPITWNGETADSRSSEIEVYSTANAISRSDVPYQHQLHDLMVAGDNVTNDWITGAAGMGARATTGAPAEPQHESPLRDHSRVMVVHGRNGRARDAMFTFLRALGLEPIEWEQAVAETGMASPHNLDAVRAAMDVGQAVVVVLTAEDRAGLLPELADGDDDDDVVLRAQPRQNVILEAGLAMGIDRSRTILVELGPIRRASDFDGLNVVRLSDTASSRNALRSRLMTAGCAVDEAASDWMRPGAGGDFEAAIVAWSEDVREAAPPPDSDSHKD
jgi:predicted nucleotide-binding protein